jgi:hypothetical protein
MTFSMKKNWLRQPLGALMNVNLSRTQLEWEVELANCWVATQREQFQTILLFPANQQWNRGYIVGIWGWSKLSSKSLTCLQAIRGAVVFFCWDRLKWHIPSLKPISACQDSRPWLKTLYSLTQFFFLNFVYFWYHDSNLLKKEEKKKNLLTDVVKTYEYLMMTSR